MEREVSKRKRHKCYPTSSLPKTLVPKTWYWFFYFISFARISGRHPATA